MLCRISLLLTLALCACPASAVNFLVTTNADSGPGSLRQAILDANATPGPDAIYFSIGSGPKIIPVLSPLPTITDTVDLNAATQPGYDDRPIITLAATGGAQGEAGLAVATTGSSIVGLIIHGFRFSPGILLSFGGEHVIAGCEVGSFTPTLGNGHGIVLSNSVANQIGLQGFAPNVMLRNFGAGILLSSSSSNVIEGNYIGTDSTGASDAGNQSNGIQLIGAHHNTIGGMNAGARNVISGNGGNGIYLNTSHFNVIEGNLIGCDTTGTIRIANRLCGINVAFSDDTVIGGVTTAARNIISGNLVHGIEISGYTSVFTVIQGNYIGTDAIGRAALPNSGSGIFLYDAVEYLVGGADAAARNVISGNGGAGVRVDGSFYSENTIEGNYIGTDATGQTALPNSVGLILTGAPANTVQSNVISGNLFTGLHVSSSSNVVAGNFVGTDVTGTRAVPNGGDGIAVNRFDNTIGGTEAGSRNVVSGNADDGIELFAAAAPTADNVVQGNYIGLDVTGGASLGNAGFGITLNGSVKNNTIGGSEPGARNFISGNRRGGVWVTGPGTTTNVLHGNYIGTEVTGRFAVPNRGPGVLLNDRASQNHIGGTEPGEGNLIAFNTGDGVLIQADAARIPIIANSIHSNGRLGINLQPIGEGSGVVASNDVGDADSGPNNLQNYPVITNVVYLPGSTILQGYLRSSTNGSFSIDVYANTATEQTGYGEGQFYVGNVDVDTDENGFTEFAFVTGNNYSNQFFTATALNYDTDDTSEFSAAMGGIRITSIQRVSNRYHISFTTRTNHTYSVDYATNLNSPSAWSPVVLPPQPIQGTGGTITITDPFPAADRMRVYRIVEQ
jgi:parallel beta-helix repeat protein